MSNRFVVPLTILSVVVLFALLALYCMWASEVSLSHEVGRLVQFEELAHADDYPVTRVHTDEGSWAVRGNPSGTKGQRVWLARKNDGVSGVIVGYRFYRLD